jgi:hypothetical protein
VLLQSLGEQLNLCARIFSLLPLPENAHAPDPRTETHGRKRF